MFLKKIKLILIILLFYQNPLYSKSNSFVDFNSKNLSKYFSGIIAFENEDNSTALNFFSTSKILLNRHDVFLKRYFYSLILENKVPQAINLVKENKDKIDFFDAYLILIIDNLKKDNFDKASFELKNIINSIKLEKFDKAILETIDQYIYVFKEKKFINNKKKSWEIIYYIRNFSKVLFERSRYRLIFLKTIQ